MSKPKKMSIFMMWFVILQPILDACSGIMIHNHIGSKLTISLLIRVIFMAIAFIYILLATRDMNGDSRKQILSYFAVLALALIINLAVNYQTKPVFQISSELSAMVKTVYYVVILLAFIIAFEDLGSEKNKYFPRNVFWAIMIVDFVMIVAHFTNTSFHSYQYFSGESGWFNAANEIGSILAIALPMVILYVVNKFNSGKEWYYWIAIIATVYSCLLLGTKVGLISVIISFVVAIIVSGVKYYSTKSRKSLILLVLFVITLGGSLLASSQMSTTQNLKAHEQLVAQQRRERRKLRHKKHLTKHERMLLKNDEVNNTAGSVLLSSRSFYLKNEFNSVKNAPLSQKLFGAGYAGNYRKGHAKLAEMDFFDVFIEYGIIGSLIVLLPLIISIFIIYRYALMHLKQMFNFQNSMLITSVTLGLGISFISGHVIGSPAVSIYLDIAVAYLVILFNDGNKKEIESY